MTALRYQAAKLAHELWRIALAFTIAACIFTILCPLHWHADLKWDYEEQEVPQWVCHKNEHGKHAFGLACKLACERHEKYSHEKYSGDGGETDLLQLEEK